MKTLEEPMPVIIPLVSPVAQNFGFQISQETRYKIRVPAPVQTTNKTTYAAGLIDRLSAWTNNATPFVEVQQPSTTVTLA